MELLQTNIDQYLSYCQYQKVLNQKTLAAYHIDLKQFADYTQAVSIDEIDSNLLEDYVRHLHQSFQPKTVKRKIASLKAFFHYLEYRDIIQKNPFHRLQIKFREPIILPKTIPLTTVELLLKTVYHQKTAAPTDYQKRNAVRDAAVLELLFASGMRISELCSLTVSDITLEDRTILIHGKGAKERRLQIGNDDVLKSLTEYQENYAEEIKRSGYYFVNQSGHPLSDQAVRRMIKKYSSLAAISLHITPHMFRNHNFYEIQTFIINYPLLGIQLLKKFGFYFYKSPMYISEVIYKWILKNYKKLILHFWNI